MNAVTLRVKVKKSCRAKRARVVEFKIDSGLIHSVLREDVLRDLGRKPNGVEDFYLADGMRIRRCVGEAYFEYKGTGGPAPVVFGEKNDHNLLGSMALEALGVVFDPLTQELRAAAVNLERNVPWYRAGGTQTKARPQRKTRRN